MPLSPRDKDILRELGSGIAQIAALPIQEERRKLRARIENLESARAPVLVYQEPWNELEAGGEMALQCQDDFCRGIELGLRRTLYQWRHYPGDMVVDAVMLQPMCIADSDLGIQVQEDILRTSDTGDIVSHHYHVQISDEADLEKIKLPRVSHNAALTRELYERRCEIFEGILPVRICGVGGFWFCPWDDIVRWTGVQEVLSDLVDRPEYVHKLVGRVVSAWLCRLDQYEEQGLLERPAKELWCAGAAQIFSAVSPKMHEEFALRHEARFFSRFAKVSYGCCEPLHHKVDVIRRSLPNLGRISMSPFIDFDAAVRNVGREFIFAWKPNPAHLATEAWHPDLVRNYLREHLQKARDGGCVVEIHLKDISTVRWEPHRLWEWARIADEVSAEVG